jgi:peptidoglycan/LPS O-acetylase OafA/YrhL
VITPTKIEGASVRLEDASPRPVRRAPANGRSVLRHRDDIQGLRAVAVLLVALGHAGVPFLRGGFVGVDVFFVLSGFLITGILLAAGERDGRVSLRDFYARRAKRILPAAALTLVVSDLAATWLLNVVRAKQTLLDSMWAAFFGANVRFATRGVDYFARSQPPSAIQHYWSLAVEEQFYLVWPLLVSVGLLGWLAWRGPHPRTVEAGTARWSARRRLAAILALVGVASLAWSIHDTPRTAAAYFSTFARAWELALGASLAIGARGFLHVTDRGRAILGWGGVGAIVLAAILFSSATPFPGSAAVLPTTGAAMVIAAGIGRERSRGGIGRLLGVSPLRYVGDRSYAFYLWHWPVLVIAAQYAGRTLPVATNVALLAGAFGLSVLSYRLLEDPLRRARLRRPLRTSGVLWGASVGLVVVVALIATAAIGGFSSGPAVAVTPPALDVGPSANGSSSPSTGSGRSDPSILPEVQAAVEAARAGAPIPANVSPPVQHLLGDRYDPGTKGCFAGRGDPTVANICPLGATTASRTVVVIGDSHAREWLPPLLWVAANQGWRVLPMIELGCGPVTYRAGCRTYADWVVDQVRSLHPDVVLIGGELIPNTVTTRQESMGGLAWMVEHVRPNTAHVVVMGDPPRQAREPTDCLLARHATMATCTTTLTTEQVALIAGAQRTVAARGAAFIPTLGWFCYQRSCPMIVGTTATYRDADHISETYALELRALFGRAFGLALGP